MKSNNQVQLRLGSDGVTEIVQQLRLSGLPTIGAPDVPTTQMLVLNPDGSVSAAPAPPLPPDPDFPWVPDQTWDCWDVVGGSMMGQWHYDMNKIVTCPPINVGIGIDEPVAKLDVRNGGIMVGYAPAYSAPFTDAALDVKGKMIVSLQPNVGPTVANAMLDVRADGNAAAFTIEALDNNGLSSFRVRNNGKVIVGSGAYNNGDNANLYLGTENRFMSSIPALGLSFTVENHPHALIIDQTTGKVGINVGDQHQFGEGQLEVNGTVRAHRYLAELVNWPDYVFHDDYDRLSLDELRQFIDIEGHLPNVPSAYEMENAPVDIGEMMRLQMEKIEELTLYILELEEKLTQLSK